MPARDRLSSIFLPSSRGRESTIITRTDVPSCHPHGHHAMSAPPPHGLCPRLCVSTCTANMAMFSPAGASLRHTQTYVLAPVTQIPAEQGRRAQGRRRHGARRRPGGRAVSPLPPLLTARTPAPRPCPRSWPPRSAGADRHQDRHHDARTHRRRSVSGSVAQRLRAQLPAPCIPFIHGSLASCALLHHIFSAPDSTLATQAQHAAGTQAGTRAAPSGQAARRVRERRVGERSLSLGLRPALTRPRAWRHDECGSAAVPQGRKGCNRATLAMMRSAKTIFSSR